MVAPGTVNSKDIVSNLDFASTFLDVADAPIPNDLQGRSLTPVLRGNTPSDWRDYHYYHYYESGGHGVPLHFGVTDGRYKLIRFPEPRIDAWELYGLESDPRELESRFGDPALSDVQAELEDQLRALQKKYEVPVE